MFSTGTVPVCYMSFNKIKTQNKRIVPAHLIKFLLKMEKKLEHSAVFTTSDLVLQHSNFAMLRIIMIKIPLEKVVDTHAKIK